MAASKLSQRARVVEAKMLAKEAWAAEKRGSIATVSQGRADTRRSQIAEARAVAKEVLPAIIDLVTDFTVPGARSWMQVRPPYRVVSLPRVIVTSSPALHVAEAAILRAGSDPFIARMHS